MDKKARKRLLTHGVEKGLNPLEKFGFKKQKGDGPSTGADNSQSGSDKESHNTRDKVETHILEKPESTAINSAEASHTHSAAEESGVSGLETNDEKKKLKHKQYKFQSSWLREYSWLQITSTGGMHCLICLQSKKTNPFTAAEGCTNFRTSTLSRHAACGEHQSALKAVSMKNDFNLASSTAMEQKHSSLVKALRNAYWLAKEQIATNKYSSLMNLLRIQGCDTTKLNIGENATYESRKTAEEFQNSIAACIQKDIFDRMRNSNFVTLLMDESTDISLSKKLVMYSHFMGPDFTPETHFIGNLTLSEVTCTADVIFSKVKDFLEEKQIPMDKVIGFGSDGASIMTGRKKGVATLVKEHSPHCIAVHCIAHRLNLCTSQASKSVSFIKDSFEKTLTDLFYYFKKSSKRTGELSEIQKVLDDPKLKIREVHEIRWLAFYEALFAVHQCWKSLVNYFDKYSSSSKTAKDLHSKLTDFRFVATSHLLMDIIPSLAQLSLIFQKQNIDMATVRPALNTVYDVLSAAKDGKSFKCVYQKIFMEKLVKQSKDDVLFNGVKLKLKTYKESMEQFKQIRKEFIDSLKTEMDRRFPPELLSVATAFEVFGLRSLSFLNEDEKLSYGKKEIQLLAEHFGTDSTSKSGIISKSKVVKDSCSSEWSLLKHVILRERYPRDQTGLLWQIIKKNHAESFPNLLTLAEIGLILPLQTADCERGFSTQNNIKTQNRNRIQEKTMNTLMLIAIEGPDIAKYDFTPAVLHWKDQKSRRLFNN